MECQAYHHIMAPVSSDTAQANLRARPSQARPANQHENFDNVNMTLDQEKTNYDL